ERADARLQQARLTLCARVDAAARTADADVEHGAGHAVVARRGIGLGADHARIARFVADPDFARRGEDVAVDRRRSHAAEARHTGFLAVTELAVVAHERRPGLASGRRHAGLGSVA